MRGLFLAHEVHVTEAEVHTIEEGLEELVMFEGHQQAAGGHGDSACRGLLISRQAVDVDVDRGARRGVRRGPERSS
jgi:hypothetical protein